MTSEFLLKVHLPEFENKITLKMLPSFSVVDAITMIRSSMYNKHIIIPNHKLYGLFLPGKSLWMEESKLLHEYGNLASVRRQKKLLLNFFNVVASSGKIGYYLLSSSI